MYRWERRDQKQKSKKTRMPKSGRSVFTIQGIQKSRADKIKQSRLKGANNDDAED
jgi:hypothetical protein